MLMSHESVMAKLRANMDAAQEAVQEYLVPEGRSDEIFRCLETLDVELDHNPLEYGPSRINEKLAQISNYKNEVDSIQNEVMEKLYLAEQKLREEDGLLTLAVQHYMIHDLSVQAARTAKEREAVARDLCGLQVQQVALLQSAVQDWNRLLTVVKAKQASMVATSRRLKDQIKMCQAEIQIGGYWGSAIPDAPSLEAQQDSLVEAEETLDTFLTNFAKDTKQASAQKQGQDELTALVSGQLSSALKSSVNGHDVDDFFSSDADPNPMGHKSLGSTLDADLDDFLG